MDPEPRRSRQDVAFQDVQRQISPSVSFLMLSKGNSPRIQRLAAQTPEKVLSASTGSARSSCEDGLLACVGLGICRVHWGSEPWTGTMTRSLFVVSGNKHLQIWIQCTKSQVKSQLDLTIWSFGQETILDFFFFCLLKVFHAPLLSSWLPVVFEYVAFKYSFKTLSGKQVLRSMVTRFLTNSESCLQTLRNVPLDSNMEVGRIPG